MPTRPPQHRAPASRSPAKCDLYELRRGSARERGYDRLWEKARLVILARDPLCVMCLPAGRLTPTTEVDHIKPLADFPELRLDYDNLRGLCKTCHSRHTILTQGIHR